MFNVQPKVQLAITTCDTYFLAFCLVVMIQKCGKNLIIETPRGGGRSDSLIHERYFGFSRTHEREKNGKFHDSKNGILSIHEPQLTNMQEFTNSRTNFSIFTNSRTIFLLFTNHERNRFHEFTNNFSHFHEFTNEKKPIAACTNTARGGLHQCSYFTFIKHRNFYWYWYQFFFNTN